MDEGAEALHLPMRPSRDAKLPAPLLQQRHSDIHLLCGSRDGHVEVALHLLQTDLPQLRPPNHSPFCLPAALTIILNGIIVARVLDGIWRQAYWKHGIAVGRVVNVIIPIPREGVKIDVVIWERDLGQRWKRRIVVVVVVRDQRWSRQ